MEVQTYRNWWMIVVEDWVSRFVLGVLPKGGAA